MIVDALEVDACRGGSLRSAVICANAAVRAVCRLFVTIATILWRSSQRRDECVFDHLVVRARLFDGRSIHLSCSSSDSVDRNAKPALGSCWEKRTRGACPRGAHAQRAAPAVAAGRERWIVCWMSCQDAVSDPRAEGKNPPGTI